MKAKVSLLFVCVFLFSYAFAGGYKEPYFFDMGSCLIALPDGYEKINRGKPDSKYKFIDFQNNGVHFKVTSSDVYHKIKNEKKLKLVESFDLVDLALHQHDTTGFDFAIFIIEGALRVITLSHGTQEEALKIALSCNR
jgi:hypothetical protein